MMNFLLEIPTWILWFIVLLLVILILILITKLWDTKDIQQPQKKVAPPGQPHKLYPGDVHDPTISPDSDVKDLVKKRIQKKNAKINDDANEESKPRDPPAHPDPQNPSKPIFRIIKGGKSGKNQIDK